MTYEHQFKIGWSLTQPIDKDVKLTVILVIKLLLVNSY